MKFGLISKPILVLLMVAMAVFGCDKVGFTKKKRIKKFFIHGDPKVLIEGAALDEQSFLTDDNLDEFDDFDFASGAIFYNKSKKVSFKEGQTIESGNEAEEGDEADAYESYSFRRVGYDEAVYEAVSVGNLPLRFIEIDGRYEVYEFAGTPLTPLHYSVSPDRSMFSILTEGKEDGREFILALYYTKNYKGVELPDDVDDEHNYLLGPGVVTRWPGKINLNICGDHSEEHRTLLEKSIYKWDWDKDGKIGDHEFVLSYTKNFKPFSDVNSHCIQMIDQFLFEDSDDFSVLGITYSIINRTNHLIVAADMVVSVKGNQKTFGKSLNKKQFQRTITHEMGHFLGLDHEFEKDRHGNAVNKSVMSYDGTSEVTTHDRESIELIYKSR